MGAPEAVGSQRDWGFRDLLDVIAAGESVASISDLNALFRPVMQGLGFSLFACVKIVVVSGRPNVYLMFGDGLEPWRRHYLSMGYGDNDPVFGECFKTADPFCWREFAHSGQTSPGALRIIQEARDFGLHEGLIAPMRKPDGSMLATLLAGPCSAGLGLRGRSAAELAAVTYGRLGRRLQPMDSVPPSTTDVLTRRQRECLRWVRRGKSSIEIATIVGISPYVVDEHISEACRRLGVHKRTEAAIAAGVDGDSYL